MFELHDYCAVVTGAATGLGQAIAIALSHAGANVAISDKPGVSLDETFNMLDDPGRHLAFDLDVRDVGSARQRLGSIVKAFGKIDCLVNNAGVNRPAAGLNASVEEWDDHFATNVRGGFFCAQAVAPSMLMQKFGRIIFISRQSGLIGIPGQPIYCATKGAVVNLVRTLALEWGPYGITVNSVAPTFVETNLTRDRLHNPAFKKFVLENIACRALASPADVASAVVYIASREAGMVNGVNLPVDGGWTAK